MSRRFSTASLVRVAAREPEGVGDSAASLQRVSLLPRGYTAHIFRSIGSFFSFFELEKLLNALR